MAVTPPSGRVVVAGGGPAALETVLALHELGTERELVLVAPGRHMTLRTLVDGRPHAVRVALAAFADELGVEHVRDVVARVDLPGRLICTQDDRELAYDALVLAVGARAIPAVPGALTYRDPRDVGRLHEALERLTRNGHRPCVVFAVPPGARRSRPLYELVLHTADRLRGRDVDIVLVTPEVRPPDADLGHALRVAGVELRPGRPWGGPSASADLVVALPHLAGPAVPGVPADAAGFTLVDADGAIEGAPGAYAIGEMATREAGAPAAQADAVARLVSGAPRAPDGTGAWSRLGPYVRACGQDVAPLG